MTPASTQERINELRKRDMTLAWHIGLLEKMDGKQFPRSPEKLWGGDHERRSGGGQSGLVAMAQARQKAQQDEDPGRAEAYRRHRRSVLKKKQTKAAKRGSTSR